MFRKIHSNRDPKDTLVSELRKEFSRYFRAAGNFSTAVLERRPRVTFTLMVGLLSAALIISFTFSRHKEIPKSKPVPAKLSPVRDGFSEIMIAGGKLKMAMNLKHLVDSLSSKKSLTAKDSLILDSALDKLQSIQKTIK